MKLFHNEEDALIKLCWAEEISDLSELFELIIKKKYN